MFHRFPDTDPPGLIDLTYFPPPEELRPYFGSAYLFTADRPVVADVTRADFAQLRFMLSGVGDYHFVTGTKSSTPECCILGATLGATRFEVDGPLQVVGVSILPLGWVALGLENAGDLADGVADMADRLSPEAATLLAAFRGMTDPNEAMTPLWTFLAGLLKPVSRSSIAFVAKCDTWLTDEPSPRVEALVEATGLSARQVERLAKRHYGAPPKYLARKFRALRCAAELALDHQDWTEMVGGAFYDQSHFIREIKHFIGLTPHQLKTDPTIVAQLTLQRRAMVGYVAEINRIS
jgi:AraC-like DNA-binding protein